MLRDALRSQTRTQHVRLEQRLAIERYLQNRLDYIELLKRFYGFYVPFEMRLMAFDRTFEAHGIELAARSKTPRLARDLHAFAQCPASLPVSPVLPDISTFPRAVGCLYVSEGSTLGGQIIMRRVRESLGLDDGNGGAFFSCYGDATGRMWQSFLRFLGGLRFDDRENQQAVSAARETFESIERWLCDEQAAAR